LRETTMQSLELLFFTKLVTVEDEVVVINSCVLPNKTLMLVYRWSSYCNC
ncbi:hypothetical protein TorRG33x02_118440, partial [Trema orientale]